jgi:multidrug efflux pump subunit AcrA (membrane-fusion protein)
VNRARLLRPIVIVPVVVVFVGAAVWLGFRSGNGAAANSQAATQQLFTVAPTTMSQTVSSSGTIAPADTENLNFSVAGTVETVPVKAGQTVKKGQVLATVGSAALLSAVSQADADLKAAQATLSDDENADASSAQIANDQAGVTTAYSNLLSATSDLSGATLTSPIAGTVATVNLSVGDVLTASGSTGANLSGTGTNSGRTNTPSSSNSSAANNSSANNSSSSAQFTVISSNYVVDLSVDTSTIGNLKVGQTATVTPTSASGSSGNSGAGGFGGFGRGGFGSAATNANGGNATSGTNAATATGDAATGKVTSVGTIASSSSGVATFPVVVTVTGTPAGFHAGASASTVIAYKTLGNVLAVPVLAITRTNGASSVTVSANGATSSRVVTTGITSGGQVQITSGLQAGEQVVVTIPARRTTTGSGSNGSTNGSPNGSPSGFPGGFPNGSRGLRGGGTP